MPDLNSISVVVPVYRSESYLEKNIDNILDKLNELEVTYEVILIEDCGGDNSWNVIKRLTKLHAQVSGIKLSRNYGQHNALLCGIRSAKNDVIVTIDDDGQHPVGEIKNMLNKLEAGADVVYARPIIENHGWLRDKASLLTKWVLRRLMKVPSAGNVSAFRAFRKDLREAFTDFRGPMVNIDIMLTWATSNFANIRVASLDRTTGTTSGYSFSKLADHAINMITGFSGLPLRIASIIGVLFAILGFSILIYTLLLYAINGVSVPGFTFLASIITLFSGVQLLTIGIIGEYVLRIHFRSMDKPPYLVTEKCPSP